MNKKMLAIVAVVALAVFALGAVAYHLYRPYPSHLINALFLPFELHSAEFVVGKSFAPYAFSRGIFAYEKDSPRDSSLVSIARSDEHVATILRGIKGEFPYRVLVDGAEVVSTGGPKFTVALSPSATRVAYAEQRPVSAFNPDLVWETVVYDIKTGERTELGEGFSPLFVDDSRLLRFSEKGIVVSDLSHPDAETVLLEDFFDDIFLRVAQSPSKSTFAFVDTETNITRIFSVNRGDELSISEVKNLEVSPSSIALSNEALYIIKTNANKSSSVLKYTVGKDKPVKVYEFPESLGVTKMTF